MRIMKKMRMKQERKMKYWRSIDFSFCKISVENVRSSMKVERRWFERSKRGPWLSLDKDSIA